MNLRRDASDTAHLTRLRLLLPGKVPQMIRIIRLLVVVVVPLLLIVTLSSVLAYPAQAGPSSTCEPDVQLPSKAWLRICMPSGPDTPWNGDLVVYAHGYVAFNKPITIPEDPWLRRTRTCIPVSPVPKRECRFASTSLNWWDE